MAECELSPSLVQATVSSPGHAAPPFSAVVATMNDLVWTPPPHVT